MVAFALKYVECNEVATIMHLKCDKISTKLQLVFY